MIWDNDAIETLTKLVKTDAPFSAIADILGCTRNAAIGKANRLQLRKHPTLIKIQYKAEPVIQFEPGQVMMVNLKKNHCRYPIGAGKDIKFCGDTKLHDSPYCKEHTAICFSPIKLKVIPPAKTL